MAFLNSQPTREDVKIEKNRGQMGVIFLRKKGVFRGLGSGSIVNLKGSNLFRNYDEIKWCLLTSDSYVEDIHVGDYFFEYWSSDLKTVKKHCLRKVAQSSVFSYPTPGLALIPVSTSWVSELFNSSVLDKRRAFPTEYYYGAGESDSSENKECFIVGSYGSNKESLTVERFTLITERDDQGRLQHCLRDDVDTCKTIFRSYGDIIAKRSHLFPRGAVILKDDGPKATCIGILNFTEEGSISPVFFTPETFTGEVQLYYPTSTDVEEEASSIRCSEDKIEPNPSQTDSVAGSQEVPYSTTAPSQAPCPIVTGHENHSQMFSSAGAEHQDGASLTNDDQTVYPDDYTLQNWQKLYEEVADENTKLKQQSEDDQKIISLLKEENAERRIDMVKTEKENDVLRAENEDLSKEKENMRSKTKELRTRCKQVQEDRDADREDYRVLLTENEQLKTINKELREDNRKLRAENTELRKEGNAESAELREDNRKLRAENSELRKNWNAESKELHEVIEELRAQNSELKTENKELLIEKEELSARHKDQLKELLNQPDSAVCGDDTSSIKDSNNVKAEEPSGSSANSLPGDSEEKPFLDSLSQDVSKLD